MIEGALFLKCELMRGLSRVLKVRASIWLVLILIKWREINIEINRVKEIVNIKGIGWSG